MEENCASDGLGQKIPTNITELCRSQQSVTCYHERNHLHLCLIYNCEPPDFLSVEKSNDFAITRHCDLSFSAGRTASVSDFTAIQPSIGSLDILPVGFYSLFSSLVEDLLHIVNSSTLSSLKTVVAFTARDSRPVSDPPFITETIEKVVYNLINHFFKMNWVCDNLQSGFRSF